MGWVQKRGVLELSICESLACRWHLKSMYCMRSPGLWLERKVDNQGIGPRIIKEKRRKGLAKKLRPPGEVGGKANNNNNKKTCIFLGARAGGISRRRGWWAVSNASDKLGNVRVEDILRWERSECLNDGNYIVKRQKSCCRKERAFFPPSISEIVIFTDMWIFCYTTFALLW